MKKHTQTINHKFLQILSLPSIVLHNFAAGLGIARTFCSLGTSVTPKFSVSISTLFDPSSAVNRKQCRCIAVFINITTRPNPKPTHIRLPCPNGRYLKCSNVGLLSALMKDLFKYLSSSKNRSGRNFSGFFHHLGSECNA